MSKEEMDKYAYELMTKNNPEEATKNLMLKDREIEELKQRLKNEEKVVQKYLAIENKLDKAIEKLEEIELYDEYITIHTDFIYDLKNILGDKE